MKWTIRPATAKKGFLFSWFPQHSVEVCSSKGLQISCACFFCFVQTLPHTFGECFLGFCEFGNLLVVSKTDVIELVKYLQCSM